MTEATSEVTRLLGAARTGPEKVKEDTPPRWAVAWKLLGDIWSRMETTKKVRDLEDRSIAAVSHEGERETENVI